MTGEASVKGNLNVPSTMPKKFAKSMFMMDCVQTQSASKDTHIFVTVLPNQSVDGAQTVGIYTKKK